MEIVLLGARLVLAAVFLAAALGKLSDRSGFRRTLADFGVPAGPARVAGTALPLVEFVVAVALVVPGSARWGGLVAAALLLAFCAGVGRALARGETPECNCFGRVRSRPVDRATLARNLLFLSLAAFVAVAGWEHAGASPTAWADGISGGEVAVVIALAALALAIALHVSFSYQLFKQNGRLVARIDALERGGAARPPGLGVGDAAPPFRLRDLDGRPVALAELLADGPLLLVFGDARCESCDAALVAAGRAGSDAGGRRIVVVASGSHEDNRAKARRYGLSTVLVQYGHEIASATRWAACPPPCRSAPTGGSPGPPPRAPRRCAPCCPPARPGPPSRTCCSSPPRGRRDERSRRGGRGPPRRRGAPPAAAIDSWHPPGEEGLRALQQGAGARGRHRCRGGPRRGAAAARRRPLRPGRAAAGGDRRARRGLGRARHRGRARPAGLRLRRLRGVPHRGSDGGWARLRAPRGRAHRARSPRPLRSDGGAAVRGDAFDRLAHAAAEADDRPLTRRTAVKLAAFAVAVTAPCNATPATARAAG